MPGPKPKLLGREQEIIDAIIEGLSFKKIAEKFEVHLSTLYVFLSSPDFSARARQAQELSADMYATMAEEVLRSAKGTLTEIQRARELAQHYRWMAGKRAPKKYGEKLDITANVETKHFRPWAVKPADGSQPGVPPVPSE